MPTPSPAIVALLATFAPAFTAPTFAHAQVLVYGTLLAVGRRTVTAALRAVGLADERHFTTESTKKSGGRHVHRPQWCSSGRACLCADPCASCRHRT